MKIMYSLLLMVCFSLHLLMIVSTKADATPEYARKYKAKCKSCHIKNTAAELTQTGLDFKASLEKARAKQGQKSDPGAPSEAAKEGEAKPADDGMKKDPQSAEAQQQDTPAEPVPPPPTYRWTRQDGTMVFTDNAELLKTQPAVKGKTKAKTAHSRVKPADGEKTASRPADRGPIIPAVSPRPPSRTYAQCMDELLSKQPAVDDTLQMMNMLTEAERMCSPVR